MDVFPTKVAQGGAVLIPTQLDRSVEKPGPPALRSVLIVDHSDESREVLRTVLEKRGVRILEARGARQGLELARRHHPEVIVLDLEAEMDDDESLCQQYEAQLAHRESSLVVLGTARRCLPGPGQRVVAKPYHYAPLVRTIEELLERTMVAERKQ